MRKEAEFAQGLDFVEFFEAEFSATARSVTRIVGDEADDVAQEAFLVTLQAWDRVRGMEKPGAWARLVARRVAWRRRSRNIRRGALEAAADHNAGTHPTTRDLDLWRAVAELPPRHRLAIGLHHISGLPVAQVAEALDATEAATKVLLFRARERLGTALSGHQGRWVSSRAWHSGDVVAHLEATDNMDAGSIDLIEVAARNVRWTLTFDHGRYEIGTDDGQRLDRGTARMRHGAIALTRPKEAGKALFTTMVDGGHARFRQVSNTTTPTRGIPDAVYLNILVAADTFARDRRL